MNSYLRRVYTCAALLYNYSNTISDVIESKNRTSGSSGVYLVLNCLERLSKVVQIFRQTTAE